MGEPNDSNQLRQRLTLALSEGRGECLFAVEPTDDFDDQVARLHDVCNQLDVELTRLHDNDKGVAYFLLRRRLDSADFIEVRVAVVGNVDAGKSTLLSVLTHGRLDDGRGQARLRIFRHLHEMQSGRTSSVSNDILGFDSKGAVVNKSDIRQTHLDWLQICTDASKVITFIDLAGHEKYLKTTIFGMTGHRPDYCMLLVGGNAGAIGMAKEHLGLALALNVPVFVVVTKIDMCPPNVLEQSMKMLTKILKSPGCRKYPIVVQKSEDVVFSAYNFSSERLCPIFMVSNVTGERLDLLKAFLNLLIVREKVDDAVPVEFQIDEVYNVTGVGTVVSGTCLKGIMRQNDALMLGPDTVGAFSAVRVKSIHRKRMPVCDVHAGHSASCWLHKVKSTAVRKGMMLLSPAVEPKVSWEFEAEVLILHHPTTIGCRYQAMLHCGSVRQAVKIVQMSLECLRTGDKALVRFRFMKCPEYVTPGQKLIFREGRTKAVGTITNIFSKLSNMPANKTHRRKPDDLQKPKKLNYSRNRRPARKEESTAVDMPINNEEKPAVAS